MRIGIDVGGTNTDAVLIDGREIRATHKASTTADVAAGVVAAIRAVLDAAAVPARDVQAVMIGTTQFTNAIVERRELLPVGVIRVALPATSGLPPLVGWPEPMAAAVRGATHLVGGGYQYDGRVTQCLDRDAVAAAARDIRDRGLRAVAISGVFSPVNGAMEDEAAEIVRDLVPDARLTVSHRIGRLGLLERENAAILNACLADLARHVVGGFRRALSALQITAPLYLSQNDGTLMSADTVEQYPVLTFASGPTNSMRGAAFLSARTDAIVADIGGTTTDIGVLVRGFPRESTASVDIGGVRTNFRMPDVLSLALGGGSIVAHDAGHLAAIGPHSVGFRLRHEALVFGGNTLTATDIAVAAGHADVGDVARVRQLPSALVHAALESIRARIAEGIDQMKSRRDDAPLLLVGGGALLLQGSVPGTSTLEIPAHAAVANAVGAAIGEAGGEVDRVYSYDRVGRDQALDDARSAACSAAIDSGAASGALRIVDVEEIPLPYVPGRAVRVRARAVGPLAAFHGADAARDPTAVGCNNPQRGH